MNISKQEEQVVRELGSILLAGLMPFISEGAKEGFLQEVVEAIKEQDDIEVPSVKETLSMFSGATAPVQHERPFDDFDSAFLAGHEAASQNFSQMLAKLEYELVDRIANKIAFTFGAHVELGIELTPVFEEGHIQLDVMLKRY